MTTITATVLKENDVKVIKDTLDRLGIEYTVHEQSAVSYGFSAEQIADWALETPAISYRRQPRSYRNFLL